MPPPVALGIGLAGSAIAGGIGASEQANAAKNARRGANAANQFAQQFRPEFGMFSQAQQQALYQQLAQMQANPQFFTQGQEAKAGKALTSNYNRQTERSRQQLNESSAARGLFRSGIGAQQERTFLQASDEKLGNALLQQQLQFQQARAEEYARAFQMNQQARQLQAGFLTNNLGQQQNLYQTLMGGASQQQQAAMQAQQAAGSALGSAIGGPFQAATTYGTLGMMGGFPGMGGGGGTVPQLGSMSPQTFFNTAPPIQQPFFGYQQQPLGFQYPGGQ